MILTEGLKTEIRDMMAQYPKPKSAILTALHRIQEEFGWCPPEAQQEVAELFDMEPGDVQSLVTFYYMYHRQPVGDYVLKVCRSISCWLRGSSELIAHLENKLGIKLGETTPDGKFTLIGGECLAACTGAPCLQVNDRFHENCTPPEADALLVRLNAGDAHFPKANKSWRAPSNG